MVKPIRLVLSAVTTLGVAVAIGLVSAPAAGASAGVYSAPHHSINCAMSSGMCTEVADSDEVFGHYVGHDEPSVLFDSNVPGSGNHMRYNITLPTDPSASNPNTAGQVLQL